MKLVKKPIRNYLWKVHNEKPRPPMAFEPQIITVLQMLLSTDADSFGEKERADGRECAQILVKAWFENEDIEELRGLLGVHGSSGRRRTRRQEFRELDLYRCYVRKKIGSARYPIAATVEEMFPPSTKAQRAAHRKKVEAARDNWDGTAMGNMIERGVRDAFARALRGTMHAVESNPAN